MSVRTVALLAAVIVVAFAGVAAGAIPGRDGRISACYAKKTGAVRVVDKGKCKKGETALSWNQAGPRGATGATGPQGPAGATGPDGRDGRQGEPGPLLDTLPSGRTQRGVFAIGAVNEDTVKNDHVYGAVTFQLPLAAKPTREVVLVGQPSTANCPGTASAPSAAPGYLCVYESSASRRAELNVFDPPAAVGSESSRFGFGLRLESDSSVTGEGYDSFGSWAVTAP